MFEMQWSGVDREYSGTGQEFGDQEKHHYWRRGDEETIKGHGKSFTSCYCFNQWYEVRLIFVPVSYLLLTHN